MTIRQGTKEDIKIISAAEAVSFPATEAASEGSFIRRMELYPQGFWLSFEGDGFIGFVNGMESDECDLSDDMYENARLYKKDGAWEVILSVVTLPEHRGKGYATKLMERVVADTKARGKKGLVLTCKEHLIGFYESVGFVSEGISESNHGGARWYQMRLEF